MDYPTPYLEGERAVFSIIDRKLFPDNQHYLILRGRDGQRCLLDESPYASYGLDPGREITCVIDKINCNGKIFPEPLHPLYEVGGCYDFNIVKTISLQRATVVVVNDGLGKAHNLQLSLSLPPKGILKCHVDCIRKGMLSLRPAGGYLERRNIQNGDIQRLTCSSIETLAGDAAYCIALNPAGDVFLFPMAYFIGKAISSGTGIDCVIYRENCRPEDVQPLREGYAPGMQALVYYQEHYVKPDLLRGPKPFIRCGDLKGESFEILASGLRIPVIRPGTPLLCTVRRYRYGQPVLETSQEAINRAVQIR